MATIYSDSYVEMFLQSSLYQEEPTGALSLLFLFLARMLPIIAQAPFFGSKVLPNPVKMALAFCLFAIFLPKLVQVSTMVPLFNSDLILYFVKEFFIGLLIGFMISIPFSIVTSAGVMIDHQRGGASLMVNDPIVQNQSSPLGLLFNMIMIVMFFVIDGPFLFIDAISTSYDVIPPDRFFSEVFFEQTSPFHTMLVGFFNQIMILSIQFATPALLVILMTDLFLGIINRLAPQVQITFLGMPLKSLLALIIVCFGLQTMVSKMTKDSYYWLGAINEAISYFNVQ